MRKVNDQPSATVRRRNARGQGKRLRQDIVAAVGRLLDEKVANDTLPVSLREVAREVGIAAQSMYLHFADKDELARAVTEDGYERLVAAMRDADAEAVDCGADARERLHAQADAYCTFARTQRGVYRLMFGYDATSFGIPRDAHPARALWQQWLAALHACENEGRRWPDGVEHAATTLWSALFGRFALWASTFGQQDPEELTVFAHRTVDTILRGAIG
ncbi:TetR/AcrR family transcriptional regulator [Streptomyces sp. NA02950]|uniref:TetR/AcrR family transcriptional regulator n=1 Tax=Streptomyces sp. NA02950 TaxID=2742137 RepID=UPI0015924446|nr:TetR/AcrR family transcriptional regulator [Streptomyces sp. NA02950]QKV94246.1 TetR/AcrR family transcriptional regulator [Streptomyces sp. NA02950]